MGVIWLLPFCYLCCLGPVIGDADENCAILYRS